MERLRHLAMRQYEMQNGIDKRHMKIPQHIEIKHSRFEIEDLKKLIKTTTKDLVIVKITLLKGALLSSIQFLHAFLVRFQEIYHHATKPS